MLDLVMRGMYGLDVLQKLRELDAEARIVVVSADIQIVVAGAGRAGGREGVRQQAVRQGGDSRRPSTTALVERDK